MTLLQEAELDDQFNVQMGKIQQAIIKLEALAGSFNKAQHWPVRSQVSALERSGKDLENLAHLMSSMRT